MQLNYFRNAVFWQHSLWHLLNSITQKHFTKRKAMYLLGGFADTIIQTNLFNSFRNNSLRSWNLLTGMKKNQLTTCFGQEIYPKSEIRTVWESMYSLKSYRNKLFSPPFLTPIGKKLQSKELHISHKQTLTIDYCHPKLTAIYNEQHIQKNVTPQHISEFLQWNLRGVGKLCVKLGFISKADGQKSHNLYHSTTYCS